MVEHFFLEHSGNIKKWMQRIIIVVISIIILCLCITKFTTGKASFFGYWPFFIMSASMEPTIMTGQFVIAMPVKPEDIKIGDIVSYKSCRTTDNTIKKTIIHRVIAINDDDTFTFKGDNNAAKDNPVPASSIGYKIIWY